MINALEYLGWSALIALCLNQLGAAAIIDNWQFRVNSPSHQYNLEVPNE
jgi:hypothetical protein